MSSGLLAILALLVEQPLHGYGIERLIEQRGMRKWTPIGFSSIYQLLDQLVAAGLADVTAVPAPGRGKQRRVHSVTEAGYDLWKQETLAALREPEGSMDRFLIALSGLPLLDPADAVAALSARLGRLETGLSELDQDLRAVQPAPHHVEAMFAFTRAHLSGELRWLRRLVATLPTSREEA